MKILVVEPEKAPYEREISDDLHEMQEVVGGLIEPVYFEPKTMLLSSAMRNSC